MNEFNQLPDSLKGLLLLTSAVTVLVVAIILSVRLTRGPYHYTPPPPAACGNAGVYQVIHNPGDVVSSTLVVCKNGTIVRP